MNSRPLLFVLALVVAGCRRDAVTPPPTTGPTDARPLPVYLQPENRPVVSGPTRPVPLTFLAESAMTLRVVDATAGRLVAEVQAGAGTILSVRPDGVYLGSEQIAQGPLDGPLYQVLKSDALPFDPSIFMSPEPTTAEAEPEPTTVPATMPAE